MYKKQLFLLLVLSFANLNVNAEFLEKSIDKNKERFSKVALDIWEFAEMGYQETKSSALLASELQKEGFKITKNVANIPTAFIAEYGSGGPIIGILGEFDAQASLTWPKQCSCLGDIGKASRIGSSIISLNETHLPSAKTPSSSAPKRSNALSDVTMSRSMTAARSISTGPSQRAQAKAMRHLHSP